MGTTTITAYRGFRRSVPLAALCCLIALLSIGCGSTPPTPAETPPSTAPSQRSRVIVIGNVDSEQVARKFQQYQGLAKYLSQNLMEFGIDQSDVIIVSDVSDMTHLLIDAKVDLYFDNPFLALIAADQSGSELFLRQWKKGRPEYHTIFMAKRDAGVSSLEDLEGQKVGFQRSRSGAGFLLPKGILLDRGFNVTMVESFDSAVDPSEIGYLHVTGERTSIDMVLNGQLAAVAFGSHALIDMPDEIKEQLVVFERSFNVPGNLVVTRPELDPELLHKIRELMVSLDQTEQGREILKAMRDTTRFDDIPVEFKEDMPRLMRILDLVTNE